MSRSQKNVNIFVLAIILTFVLMLLQFMWVGWGLAASMMIAAGFAAVTLFAGLLSYAIQARRHQSALASKHKGVQDQAVEARRSVELDLPLDQAFELAQAALQSLHGERVPNKLLFLRPQQQLHIHGADRAGGHIRAGLRSRTWGLTDPWDFSRIDIRLNALDARTTQIEIAAMPSNPIEAFDMGRHLHYVNTLALFLRRESQNQSQDQGALARLSDTAAQLNEDLSQGDPAQSDHRQMN